MDCRHLLGEQWILEYTDEQMTRAFIMYIMWCSILCSRGDRIHRSLLGSLENIEEIHTYNWGGVGLETLYWYIDEVSRGQTFSTGSFGRAWEVIILTYAFSLFYIYYILTGFFPFLLQIWSYVYLKMMAPSSILNETLIIPQAYR